MGCGRVFAEYCVHHCIAFAHRCCCCVTAMLKTPNFITNILVCTQPNSKTHDQAVMKPAAALLMYALPDAVPDMAGELDLFDSTFFESGDEDGEGGEKTGVETPKEGQLLSIQEKGEGQACPV